MDLASLHSEACHTRSPGFPERAAEQVALLLSATEA